MAKFEKGNPGKPKGAKHKATAITRQLLSDLLAGEGDKIRKELAALEGTAYLKAVVDLLAFVLPKPSAEPTKGDEGTKTYTVTFNG